MNINKIKILLTLGPDKIILFTDLPPSMWPYTENAIAKMEVAHDYGEKYVKENFKNISYEIINTR